MADKVWVVQICFNTWLSQRQVSTIGTWSVLSSSIVSNQQFNVLNSARLTCVRSCIAVSKSRAHQSLFEVRHIQLDICDVRPPRSGVHNGSFY